MKLVILAALLVSGCLCCTPPGTPEYGGQDADATAVVDETTGAPTTTSRDRVCEEATWMCDAKTSPAERAFCRKSLGC